MTRKRLPRRLRRHKRYDSSEWDTSDDSTEYEEDAPMIAETQSGSEEFDSDPEYRPLGAKLAGTSREGPPKADSHVNVPNQNGESSADASQVEGTVQLDQPDGQNSKGEVEDNIHTNSVSNNASVFQVQPQIAQQEPSLAPLSVMLEVCLSLCCLDNVIGFCF